VGTSGASPLSSVARLRFRCEIAVLELAIYRGAVTRRFESGTRSICTSIRTIGVGLDVASGTREKAAEGRSSRLEGAGTKPLARSARARRRDHHAAKRRHIHQWGRASLGSASCSDAQRESDED
jgi:hypothetical protein